MKVVFFAKSTEKAAGIRYRVQRFAEMLAHDGHECVVCLPSSVWVWERLWARGTRPTKLVWVALVLVRRMFQLRHVFGADAIVVRGAVSPYGLGPPVFERLMRLVNPRMIYDIDDAVWERHGYVDSPFYRLVDFNWIWKMCRMCACGIVGNEYLKEHVERHNPKVVVVPTCIDVQRYTLKSYPVLDPGRPVTLGWTGTCTNLGYMDLIAEPLRRLAAKHQIVLSIAADGEYRLPGVDVVNHGWDMAHEIDYLREPDIGLMPLTDTAYARGKCAFKALQYMGVGTPCVVSPVGMNATIIEDGVDGFLARSPEEWYEKLERLIVSAELRRRMGERARQRVIDHYSFEAHYSVFKGVIESVAGMRKSGS